MGLRFAVSHGEGGGKRCAGRDNKTPAYMSGNSRHAAVPVELPINTITLTTPARTTIELRSWAKIERARNRTSSICLDTCLFLPTTTPTLNLLLLYLCMHLFVEKIVGSRSYFTCEHVDVLSDTLDFGAVVEVRRAYCLSHRVPVGLPARLVRDALLSHDVKQLSCAETALASRHSRQVMSKMEKENEGTKPRQSSCLGGDNVQRVPPSKIVATSPCTVLIS